MIVATVETDSGFSMRYEVSPDGPLPAGYYLNGFWVPDRKVPENEKDDLYGKAWDRWHQRHHSDDVDFDDGLTDEPG